MITIQDSMRALGKLGCYVWLKYDPARESKNFTVIVDDDRRRDTDDPAELLFELLERRIDKAVAELLLGSMAVTKEPLQTLDDLMVELRKSWRFRFWWYVLWPRYWVMRQCIRWCKWR